jgi:hypothetical protein
MIKREGRVTSEEVESQARRIGAVSGSPTPIAFGGFTGFAVSCTEEEIPWKRYWLAQCDLLLFATFTGSEKSWQSRGRDIEGMLATLEDRAVEA